MKKIIALLGAISMLLSAVPVYARVVPHEENELLQSIGIWKEEYVGGNITRNEFAEIVIAMRYGNSVEEINFGENEPVDIAVSEGIMFLYDSGEVGGEYFITLDEALYSLVKLLGYTKIAEYYGAYPNGYRTIASDQKLLYGTNIRYSDYVSYENMAKIIRNTLMTDICRIEIENGSMIIDPTSDVSYLEEVYNIYKINGQITQNTYSSITGASTIGENEIEIGGVVVYTDSVEIPFLLGYEAEAYYKDNDGEFELVYCEPIRDNELFIYARDIESYENGVLRYYLESKNVKNAKISQDAVYIYNGKAVSEFNTDMLTPEIGDITLLKVNKSGNYNVVIIDEYKNYVVDNINFENRIIYDKLTKENFTWSESARIEIYSAYYTPLSEKDVSEGSVVSITESIDGELLRLMVNSSIVTGNVSSVSDQDGKKAVVVDEVKYYMSPGTEKYLKTPAVGSTCDLYLDIDGNIAYFVQTEFLSQKPAYIINKFIDEDEIVKLKLFDGEIKIVPCYYKIKIDGIRYRNNIAIEDALFVNKMCIYKINSKGEIIYIDFPSNGVPSDPEEEETLRSVQNIDSKTWYLPSINGFMGKFLIGSTTKVFVIPEEKDNYSEYKLTDKSYFISDTYSGIKAYSIGDDAAYAGYIVYDRSADEVIVKGDAQAYIVSKFENIVDEYDNIIKLMTYYDKNGNTITKPIGTNVDIDDISPGDLIKIGLRDDVIEKISMVFDISEQNMGSEANTQYFDSYYTYAHRRIGDVLFLGEGTAVNDIYKLTSVPVSCTVLKYNLNKATVSIGSASDIVDYEHDKTNPTYFFMHLQSGLPQNIVIWE